MTLSHDPAHWGDHPARAWGTLLILLLLAILSYLDRSIISLLVVDIQHDLGLSDFLISLVQGLAFGVFFALFGLPMGWAVDRYPRRRVIFWGVTLWSLATASCGLASRFWHLLLARFGVGIGEATLSPAAYSMITDLFPRRRLALAMGVFATGSSIGSAVAFGVGGHLIAQLKRHGEVLLPMLGSVAPWQMAFLAIGLPGTLLAFLVFLVPEPVRRGLQATHSPVGSPQQPVDSLWRHVASQRRYLLPHFLGFGCLAILAYAQVSWLPAFLMRRFDMPVGEVGLAVALAAGPPGVAGFLFSGWIADRLYARGMLDAHFRWFLVGLPLAWLAAWAAFHWADTPITCLLAASIGFFLHPFSGPAVAHLQMATPAHLRGRTAALFVLVFNLLGLSLGPSLVAACTDFIFEDKARVGDSLVLVFSVLVPVIFALFAFNLKTFREAVPPADGHAAPSARASQQRPVRPRRASP